MRLNKEADEKCHWCSRKPPRRPSGNPICAVRYRTQYSTVPLSAVRTSRPPWTNPDRRILGSVLLRALDRRPIWAVHDGEKGKPRPCQFLEDGEKAARRFLGLLTHRNPPFRSLPNPRSLSSPSSAEQPTREIPAARLTSPAPNPIA